MLTQENRLEIESKLRKYYSDIKQISILEDKIKSFQLLKDRIEDDIKNCRVSIQPDLNMGVGFDEKVQTSPTGESYAESAIIKQIGKMEDKKEELQVEISKVLLQIADLQTQNSDLKSILDRLGHVYIDIVEMAYRKGMSNINIGIELNLDESCIRRKKREALEIICKLIKK